MEQCPRAEGAERQGLPLSVGERPAVPSALLIYVTILTLNALGFATPTVEGDWEFL